MIGRNGGKPPSGDEEGRPLRRADQEDRPDRLSGAGNLVAEPPADGFSRAPKGLKARLTIASEFVKSSADLANKAAAPKEVIAALNADIPSTSTQTAVALRPFCPR